MNFLDSELIQNLTEEEEYWWDETIKEFRGSMVKEPEFYAQYILEKKGITKEVLLKNIESLIFEVREEIWQLYLKDESEFHTKVISYLVESRDLPKNILVNVIAEEFLQNDLAKLSKEEITGKVARIVGNYSGRIMPYIYALSLSTTQSRRSRAGKTFERLIETFMEILGIPFGNQSSLGTSFYKENNLGKKVDLIVPGSEEYVKNRAKCAIVTMKTTLRERWQEVAEELSRTNVPHIYLLTVDDTLTNSVITTMKHYNITVVLYKTEKETKFTEHDNVQDFNNFFTKEMPHIISYWKNNNDSK